MLASQIIISICFLVVVVLLFTNKLNRAIASVTAAVITYFVLVFIEKKGFDVIVELLFGTPSDNFVNLHALILIVGMMFIVQISDEAGLFQFIGVLAIKLTKGKPIALMSVLATISVIFSALINNILTVMILIPLTITISRILTIDPTPYIITEAIMVNIGGTFFSISSIPNILITTESGISFREFFVNVGLFSLLMAVITIGFFIFLYRQELREPRKRMVDTLEEFNVWNFVPNRKLLYASMSSLLLLIVLLVSINSDKLTPDVIALSIAMLLTIFSTFNGLKPKEIMKKFDIELLLYLLGIFVLAGGLEAVGVIEGIGNALQGLGSSNPVFQFILIIWIGAFLSALIDNIPITKVLLPVVGMMSSGSNYYYYALAFGANWGDNLTPLGDNVLVFNLAEQHNRPIKTKTFWKLGFATTILQLIIVSIYFTFFSIQTYLIGLIPLILIIATVGIVFIFSKYGNDKIKSYLNKWINKFRSLIIS
ncbi:MAG: Inner membrane protein YbiR [Candidatus Heimdallarchaeota archaeon AB_125]|nr:MAG: Inner membrane protein YbiR [Candidatus Heimdallarchaeota archaeon AB_125]